MKQQPILPEAWGPHFWYFLHTVAYTYPEFPTSVTKRKYYDLIQNMPLFVPDLKMGDKLSEFLDRYPVSPYLDSRESFMRWVHFIHNKFNIFLGKEEISFYQGLDNYYQANMPKPIVDIKNKVLYRDIVYISILGVLCTICYLYARK
jgi:hypothetical protein|uniref:thiol oxidase n=1 Tax=viral metagenome TaxID=1070528 RepID=A0A6C0IBU7_9ZZZZ